jgi:hypothetical protein
MKLGQIRAVTRTLLSEDTPSYWSNNELNTYINMGLEDICSKTDILEDISTYSLVQYQADYDLPSDYTKIKRVEITKGSSIYEIFPADLDEAYQGMVRTTSNPPYGYNLWQEKVRLTQRPSTGATADKLDGDITASDTTITLDSSSLFPKEGRVIIDDEIISYTFNDGTNNQLTGCVRGIEGTTAVTHSSGGAVTLRDMWVYHFKKDATLTLDSDTPSIPSQFHEALSWHAAYIARHKSKDYDLAEKFRGEYDKKLTEIFAYVKYKWARRRRPK